LLFEYIQVDTGIQFEDVVDTLEDNDCKEDCQPYKLVSNGNPHQP
jgi:hypothetical protein